MRQLLVIHIARFSDDEVSSGVRSADASPTKQVRFTKDPVTPPSSTPQTPKTPKTPRTLKTPTTPKGLLPAHPVNGQPDLLSLVKYVHV